MAFDGDPYRILGLARGASLDEIKRAYRRLAKANHPDAVGSAALPRFLAIQAAYEQLAEGSGRTGVRPGKPSERGRRASEADPGRAEATRRAYGGRARGRRTTAGQGGPVPPHGPAETGGTGSPDQAAGRRRGKATLGSTSYDDADAGPVEPDWSGASWYGTTSGTYWTINPKEYADPRKHGPEYQARARRASGARSDATLGSAGSAAPDLEHGAPVSVDHAPDVVDGATGATQAAGEPPRMTDEPVPDPAQAMATMARALTDPRSGGVRGRAIRAVLGWLPIALGLGWLLGELTGCDRFAATCDPAVDPLILLIQGGALVALLLLPLAASLAAGAAIGLIAAAVAATLVLSATGAAADEGSRRTTLGVLLLVAWLGGLAVSIVQRLRSASSRVRPVS
jgi:hypothetical protein